MESEERHESHDNGEDHVDEEVRPYYSGMWPRQNEDWHEAFWSIQRARPFLHTLDRIRNGQARSVKQIELDKKKMEDYLVLTKLRGVQKFNYYAENWTEKELAETLGVVPVDSIRRVIRKAVNVGDRVQAVKPLAYEGGPFIHKGASGVVKKAELDRKQYIGISWDGSDKVTGAEKHEITKAPLYGVVALASRPDNCRWPALSKSNRCDKFLLATLVPDDASGRMNLRKGYLHNTVALEDTFKLHWFIVVSKTITYTGVTTYFLRYEDYTQKPLDDQCSFWFKATNKTCFTLESCAVRGGFVGVTQPPDPKIRDPVMRLYEGAVEAHLKTFVFRSLGQAALEERVEEVNVYAIGGRNVAVKWSPNVGKVRIWTKRDEDKKWVTLDEVGGYSEPSAWIFTAKTRDPIRICVAPILLRHFFDRLKFGEWTRFGGLVSDKVEFPDDDLSETSSLISSSSDSSATLPLPTALSGSDSSRSKSTSRTAVTPKSTSRSALKSSSPKSSHAKSITPKSQAKSSTPKSSQPKSTPKTLT